MYVLETETKFKNNNKTNKSRNLITRIRIYATKTSEVLENEEEMIF